MAESFFFPDPTQLSLSSSLGSLMFQLVNQTTHEKEIGTYGALSKVVLVFSQGNRISDRDFESAQRILQGSMQQFPDLYFVFVSNDISSFIQMVGDDRQGRINARLVSSTVAQFYTKTLFFFLSRQLKCRNVIITLTQIL
jgi:hypothetical protein